MFQSQAQSQETTAPPTLSQSTSGIMPPETPTGGDMATYSKTKRPRTGGKPGRLARLRSATIQKLRRRQEEMDRQLRRRRRERRYLRLGAPGLRDNQELVPTSASLFQVHKAKLRSKLIPCSYHIHWLT